MYVCACVCVCVNHKRTSRGGGANCVSLPLKARASFLFGHMEGMIYLTTHSTHFIYVGHMIKGHSDSQSANPLPPHRLLFPISSKGSFICIIQKTE